MNIYKILVGKCAGKEISWDWHDVCKRFELAQNRVQCWAVVNPHTFLTSGRLTALTAWSLLDSSLSSVEVIERERIVTFGESEII